MSDVKYLCDIARCPQWAVAVATIELRTGETARGKVCQAHLDDLVRRSVAAGVEIDDNRGEDD